MQEAVSFLVHSVQFVQIVHQTVVTNKKPAGLAAGFLREFHLAYEGLKMWWPPEMSKFRTLTLELAHFILLIGSKNLVEGCLGLGVGGNHLRGEIADGCRGSRDPVLIIILNGRLQVLVSSLHVVMVGGATIGRIGENGGGLLLLRRSERQQSGHALNLALNMGGRIGRAAPFLGK